MTMLPACVPHLPALKLEEMNPSLGSLQDQVLDIEGQTGFSLSGGRCASLESGILPSSIDFLSPEILSHELILLIRLECLSSPRATRLCYILLQQLPPGSCVALGVESRLHVGFLN